MIQLADTHLMRTKMEWDDDLGEKLGGVSAKFIPDYARGFPDRLVLLPHGELFWVETKRPVGGVLAAAQLVQHERLCRLGQRVMVCRSKEEVDALLQSVGSPSREE